MAMMVPEGQWKHQLPLLVPILPGLALPRWRSRDLAQCEFPHLAIEEVGLGGLWGSFQLDTLSMSSIPTGSDGTRAPADGEGAVKVGVSLPE